MSGPQTSREAWSRLLPVGLAGLLILAVAAAPQEEHFAATPYSPVAPASAVLTALRMNLDVVAGWVDDGDFVSAAQAAEGTAVMARVLWYYSDQPAWRSKADALVEACANLARHAKQRETAGTAESIRRSSELLAALRAQSPGGMRVVGKSPDGFGSNRVWMRLMDGIYADAKSAKNPAELAELAYALAEAANVTEQLRDEDRWRRAARQAREAAVGVAQNAPGMDLKEARFELKNVYRRCEGCHELYNRR